MRESDLISEQHIKDVEASRRKVNAAETASNAARPELTERQETTCGLQMEFDKILTWADLYGQCTLEAKKMILSQLIKAVRVYRDYELEVDFNISFEEFQHYRSEEADTASEQAGELPARG